MHDARDLMRHFLAALAYRTQKALRDAPSGFAAYRAGPGVRTPAQLLHHMSGVLSYALSHFEPLDPRIAPSESFDEEIRRFHAVLDALGRHLDRGTPLGQTSPERLLQGPFADAMTHAGQLALLRRLAGSPIPPENFHAADVSVENLGSSQPQPVSPDAEWRDAEGNRQEPGDA